MNGVQTRFKCKLDVKRCKRFVFPPSSLLPRSNALKTKAIRYFQTDRTLTRIVSPPLIGLIGYLIGFYLTLSTDIHISQLYLPTVCRGFAYAVLSATFMVCLEEIMTFQHFFQGLSVFNMLHMVVGGVVGAAVYAQGLAYYVPDNLARYGSAIDHVAFSSSPFNLGHYMEEFISQMMEISIKQIYGWVAYACIFLFLLLLLYDFPARRSLKNIPSWKEVAREVKNTFWRTTHTPSEKEK